MACGSYHTAALTADGTLFTFGRGGGRLGLDHLDNVLAPAKVGGVLAGQALSRVACGVCGDCDAHERKLHCFGTS